MTAVGGRYKAREPEAGDPFNAVRVVAVNAVPSLDPAHTAEELVVVPEGAFAAPLSVPAADFRKLFEAVEEPVGEPEPWTTPVAELVR